MSTTTYLLGIAAAVLALIAIVELLRRRRLRERHALWWFIGAVVVLIAAVFPASVTWLASVLGFGLPVNLAFFFAIVLLFLVSLQHSGELTDLENKTRSLAEEVALQRARVDELERTSHGRSGEADV